MKVYSKLAIFIMFGIMPLTIYADGETIVDHINQTGSIEVCQPIALNSRLMRVVPASGDIEIEDEVSTSAVATKVRAGYRVQVFDDNNVRTAKQEAQNRKKQLEVRFPEYAAYVSFNSPYWRVKVGDFKSRSEAEAAMAEIRHAFPSMAKSLRIVRDRINQQ